MQVFVKCPLISSTTGECCQGIIALEVDTSETIEEVKSMINNRGGLKVEHQQLAFQGNILDQDTRTLHSYKITNNSTLEETSAFLIVTTDTKDILLGVVDSDLQQTRNVVKKIKAIVQEREGIPIQRQIMLIKDTVQENDVTLCDSEVSGAHIVVMPDNTGPMKVNVKTLTGKSYHLNMKPTQTVIQVKCYILHKHGTPPSQQSLIFNQKQLENSKTLSDYNIQDEDTIHLVPRVRGNLQIYIRTVSGKTTALRMKSSDTIGAVKTQIRDKEGVSIGLQCLSFNDRLLEDSRTLKSYNIQNKNTLYIFYTGTDCCSNTPLSDTCIQEGKIDAYHTSITIAFADGREQLKINANLYKDTVLSLKTRIQTKFPGIPPPSQQQLICNGLIMEDSQLLRKFEMSIFQRHPIVLRKQARQRVFVRTPTSSMIDVQILSEKNVANLKCLIQDRTFPPIKVSKQQLYYQGIVLENTHTISRCNFSSAPMLQLCKSQCLHEPLEEVVGSEGKLISWQQHGVEVTVPPISHGYVELRVYNAQSASCFEYPPEYNPVSDVYEIAVSSREGNAPQGVTVTISKFVQCSNLCLLAASRNPAKWTPDFFPVFNFSKVEGLDACSFVMGHTNVILKTSGAYLFVADCQPISESKKLQLLKPTPPLVEPVTPRVHSVLQQGPATVTHRLKSLPAYPSQVPMSLDTLPHRQYSSPEYRTMLSYTKKLKDVIALDPQRTCDEMMAAGLIQSDHTRDFVYHPTHHDRDKAAKLVHGMTDRVKVDPSEFDKFVATLKNEPLTDCIGQDLLTALVSAKSNTVPRNFNI